MGQEIWNLDLEEKVKHDLLGVDEGTDVEGRIELKLLLMQDMFEVEARNPYGGQLPPDCLGISIFPVAKHQEVNLGGESEGKIRRITNLILGRIQEALAIAASAIEPSIWII